MFDSMGTRTLTLLFTDLVDSAALLQRAGDERAIARQQAAQRPVGGERLHTTRAGQETPP